MLRLLLPLLLLSSACGFPMHDADEPLGGDPFADPGEISLYQAWRTYKQQHGRPTIQAMENEVWGDGLLGDTALGSGPVRDRLEAWAGWLNPWGEGELLIFDKLAGNISIPHRPAAYPAHLPLESVFPVQGTLLQIQDFPGARDLGVDEYGCAELPLISETTDAATATFATTTNTSSEPLIALIIRGHCSFSHKTRLAQYLHATAVIVADDTATPSETEEQGRTRTGLLTMYSPDDTTDIRIGSTFVSRAGWLVLRDLMEREGGDGGVEVRIEPDDGYDWPLSDLLVFIMLLPSVITIFAILLNKYRAMRQRQRDRAPKETVFALPEAVWVPEEWEKEDDSPAPTTNKLHSQKGAGAGENDGGDLGDTSTDEHGQHQRTLTVTGMPKQKPADLSTSTTPNTSAKASKKRKFYSKDECAICLGSFERGDIIRILPCGHLFHKLEVDDWLVKWKKVCPVCRMDITAAPSDSTLAIPAQTATTPLTVVPTTPSSDSDAEPHTGWWFGSSVWERMRNVFRNRNRTTEAEGQGTANEEGEETPLLRV